jgi:hypothetical protein
MFRAQNRAQKSNAADPPSLGITHPGISTEASSAIKGKDGVAQTDARRLHPEAQEKLTSTSEQVNDSIGRLLSRPVEELQPHPSYARHQFTVSAPKLSALIEQGDLAFQEPLVISVDGTIIDGYARWQLALQQGRRTVTCIQYELTEEEALLWLLHSHCRSDGLNQFCRILLSQELESPSKARALANQKRGGRNKGSSMLTEAERVDVRSRIAARARASVGNVSKVQQLTTTAIPELLGALRNGEISINLGWLLSKKSAPQQSAELALERCKKNIKKDMRTIACRHVVKTPPVVSEPRTLIGKLLALDTGNPGSIRVVVSNARGKTIAITRELLLEIDTQQELYPDAKEPGA